MAAANEAQRDLDLLQHIRRYCNDAIDAAHHYHRTDPHQLWMTATADLPALQEFCDNTIFLLKTR